MIRIDTNSFVGAVKKAVCIIPANTLTPCEKQIKLVFSKNSLQVISTDLDNFVDIQIPAELDEERSVLVDAKNLLSAIRSLRGDFVNISFDNTHCIFASEFSRYNLSCCDSVGYPRVPREKHSFLCTLKIHTLIKMIEKTSIALASERGDCDVFKNYYFTIKDSGAGIVCTDGHKLVEIFVDTDYKAAPIDFVIKASTFKVFKKILKKECSDVFIYLSIDGKWLSFVTNNITLDSRISDGPYPEYRKIFPKAFKKEAVINRNDLLETLNGLTAITNKKTHMVECEFSTDKLVLIAEDKDNGSRAERVLQVKWVSENNFSIGFNCQYLIEILSQIDTDFVTEKFNGETQVCVISPEPIDKLFKELFLIMPLHILK